VWLEHAGNAGRRRRLGLWRQLRKLQRSDDAVKFQWGELLVWRD
jgi:hypothetical protein